MDKKAIRLVRIEFRKTHGFNCTLPDRIVQKEIDFKWPKGWICEVLMRFQLTYTHKSSGIYWNESMRRK